MDRQIKKAFHEKVDGTAFPQHVNIEKLLQRKKKKKQGWKQNIAVASMFCSLVAIMVGLTFPASAGSIPIVGDIFKFFDKEKPELRREMKVTRNGGTGLHQEYERYSNEINLTRENNGIKFTVHNAIYDGKTVTIAYSFESDQDLGGNPFVLDFLKIKEGFSSSGSNGIQKVDEHKYVGLLTVSNLEATTDGSVNVKWKIDSITNSETRKEVKGNWNFEFTLKATERKEKVIHRSVEQDGIQVSIEKLAISPMSFLVYYNQTISEQVKNKWDEVYVDLKIKDDVGNHYAGEGNGGMGDESSSTMSWGKTFQQINPNATKLIITPHVILQNHTPDNYGEVGGTGGRKFSVLKKIGPNKEEIILKDIIIELNK